jgi:hypothetical protein
MRRRAVLTGLGAAALAGQAHASSYRQTFARPAADVYAALIAVLPALDYKIKSQNDDLMRLLVSAGMSAFSFGETMTIAVVEESEKRSALELDGELKMSSNILAKGRVLKHFERIASAVSAELKIRPPDPQA